VVVVEWEEEMGVEGLEEWEKWVGVSVEEEEHEREALEEGEEF
jgi:hypothetical protein